MGSRRPRRCRGAAAGGARAAHGVAIDECRCLVGARGQAPLQADAADRRMHQGRDRVREGGPGGRVAKVYASITADEVEIAGSSRATSQPAADRARADGDRDRRPHHAGDRDRGGAKLKGRIVIGSDAEPAPKVVKRSPRRPRSRRRWSRRRRRPQRSRPRLRRHRRSPRRSSPTARARATGWR